MSRFEFGGVMAAWVVGTVEDGTLGTVLVLPATDAALSIYDAPSGSQVTDLLDADGNATTSVIVPAGDGYIPRFSGPDGIEVLWTQASSGEWLPIPRYDTGESTGSTGDVVLAGGNAYEYTDSQSAPWLVLKRPNDNSDSSVWANMLEAYYWDASTSAYKLGFYLNEKGMLRSRGTTPDDTAARFMAHQSQGASVSIMDVTLSDNTEKLFQIFTGKVVSQVPLTVPYLVNPLGERLYFGTQDPNDGAYPPNIGDAWLDYNGDA